MGAGGDARTTAGLETGATLLVGGDGGGVAEWVRVEGVFLVFVLELVELPVEAAVGEQLLVGALLAELAFVHDEDGVGALDGGEAVGDEDEVRPSTMRSRAPRMRSSVSVSTLEVASSRMRMRGL